MAKQEELPEWSPRQAIGRCVNGAQRDGGRVAHAVRTEPTQSWTRAKCGYVPGRLSSGWDSPESWDLQDITCRRCRVRMKVYDPHKGWSTRGEV